MKEHAMLACDLKHVQVHVRGTCCATVILFKLPLQLVKSEVLAALTQAVLNRLHTETKRKMRGEATTSYNALGVAIRSTRSTHHQIQVTERQPRKQLRRLNTCPVPVIVLVLHQELHQCNV